MRTIAIMSLTLAAAGTAQASSLHCSDPTAQAVYAASQYDGGAPPPPFMITASETASLDGVELGTNEYSQDAGWTRTFTASFAEDTRVDLQTVADRAANLSTDTYAIMLTLAPTKADRHFAGYVVCAESNWIIPPP